MRLKKYYLIESISITIMKINENASGIPVAFSLRYQFPEFYSPGSLPNFVFSIGIIITFCQFPDFFLDFCFRKSSCGLVVTFV